MFRVLLAAALVPAVVVAQDPYEVRLSPRARVVSAGSDIKLELTIEVRADTEIPAVLLSGLHLQSKIDGRPGPELEEPVAGNVKLTARTTVTRELSVPAARLPLALGSDLVDVTFAWRDVPGATAVVKVAPDCSDIQIADLDLAQSRVLLVTNYGRMTVRFFPDRAPATVENFVKLAKEHFYDGTRFHRVVKDFMIQGGCPNTRAGAQGMPGTGNPGYTVKAEFNDTKHVRGVLSMARSAHPDSAGSQFFIMHGTAPHLDHNYTAFGELESGLDTLDRIADVQVRPAASGEASEPVEPVHLYAAILLPVLKGK